MAAAEENQENRYPSLFNDAILGEFIRASYADDQSAFFERSNYDWLGLPVYLEFLFHEEDSNERNVAVLHEICANKEHWDKLMLAYGLKYCLEKGKTVEGIRLFRISVDEALSAEDAKKIMEWGEAKSDFTFTYAVKHNKSCLSELTVAADLEKGAVDAWTDIHSKDGYEAARLL